MDDLLEEEEEEEYEAHPVASHEPQSPPAAPQPAQPDLRRRRSRSFPNSALHSTLSSTDSSTGRLEVVCASDAAAVEDADDEDRFEKVNVRSRQPVLDGETSSQQQQQHPPQSRPPEDRRIGDSADEEESIDICISKAKLASSRQVFSHEERPCGSVNYVTSPTVEDPRFDSEGERVGNTTGVAAPRKDSIEQIDSAGTAKKLEDTAGKT